MQVITIERFINENEILNLMNQKRNLLDLNQRKKVKEILEKSVNANYDMKSRFSSQNKLPLFVINENGLVYDPSHGSFYKINSDSKLSVGDFLYVIENKSSPSGATLIYKEKGKEIAPRKLNIIDSLTNQGINQKVFNAQKYSSNVDKVQKYLKPNDLKVINLVNDFVYNQK